MFIGSKHDVMRRKSRKFTDDDLGSSMASFLGLATENFIPKHNDNDIDIGIVMALSRLSRWCLGSTIYICITGVAAICNKVPICLIMNP